MGINGDDVCSLLLITYYVSGGLRIGKYIILKRILIKQDVNLIHAAYNCILWQAVVNAIIDFRVSERRVIS
jgi:hypothetical protein